MDAELALRQIHIHPLQRQHLAAAQPGLPAKKHDEIGLGICSFGRPDEALVLVKVVERRRGRRHREESNGARRALDHLPSHGGFSDSAPEKYFPDVENQCPGALSSQWIPMDKELWKVDAYRAFLEARRKLLAEATDSFLRELLHGELPELAGKEAEAQQPTVTTVIAPVGGGVDSEEEEAVLLGCRAWVAEQGLSEGEYLFEVADQDTGSPLAVFDLAWPEGLQAEFSQPVALLIDEDPELLKIANNLGFKYFTGVDALKKYVERDVLAYQETGAA